MYAGVLYMQPSWCSFFCWPHSDITSLGRSVTCTFLASPFFTAEIFWDRIYCITIIYHIRIFIPNFIAIWINLNIYIDCSIRVLQSDLLEYLYLTWPVSGNLRNPPGAAPVSLYYEKYYWGEQRWYHTTIMPKIVYIIAGLYLAVFYTFLLAIQKDSKVQTNCKCKLFLALM